MADTTSPKTWQKVAEEAQRLRDDSLAAISPPIPEVPSELPDNVAYIPRDLLTPEEIRITETTPEDLVASLAQAKLSAVEVTSAFLRRAALAQKLVVISVSSP